MNREEITNSQDYKATEAAMKYCHSLPEEYKARINNLGPEPDVIDAYEEGVIYGWNNPNWISVEDELPKEQGKYMFRLSNGDMCYETYYPKLKLLDNVTHWMPIVPPRKEEINE